MATRPPAHLRRGVKGEDAAAAFLEAAGYVILARNWRRHRLELDLVCRHGDVLVFVEVKTRAARGLAAPADALTPAKQASLNRAAAAYLSEYALWETPCRFDLVAVTAGPQAFEVEHVPDAFQWSQTLRDGDAAWQPW